MEKIYRDYFESYLGLVEIEETDCAISKILFVEEKKEIISSSLIDYAKKEIEEYLLNKRKEFTFPIKIKGTCFSQKVYQEVLKVSYGNTSTYKKIAEGINNPKSVRAVSNAIAKNQLLLVIPCHRIIGSDNKMHGYRCGINRKINLLELEKTKNL